MKITKPSPTWGELLQMGKAPNLLEVNQAMEKLSAVEMDEERFSWMSAQMEAVAIDYENYFKSFE